MRRATKIAVLGPAGTNGHEAAEAWKQRSGMKVETVFCDQVAEVFSLVGSSCFGLVPIESSAGGLFIPTIVDGWLNADRSNFPICIGEVVLEPEGKIRYQVLARGLSREPAAENRTALIFWVSLRPESLTQVLLAIASEGIQIKTICSLPAETDPVFYCEFDEHIESRAGRRAFDAIGRRSRDRQLLGSFPRGW